MSKSVMAAPLATSSGSSPVRYPLSCHILDYVPTTVAVGVEAETRLRALRWHISKALEPQDSARVLRDSTFFVRRGTTQEGDNLEPCRVHMAIEEITRTRVCDLVLVLA